MVKIFEIAGRTPRKRREIVGSGSADLIEFRKRSDAESKALVRVETRQDADRRSELLDEAERVAHDIGRLAEKLVEAELELEQIDFELSRYEVAPTERVRESPIIPRRNSNDERSLAVQIIAAGAAGFFLGVCWLVLDHGHGQAARTGWHT